MRRAVIAGVDEAGRGPVIGPMVVCGVAVSPGKLKKLEGMGLKDSKLLTPKRREELALRIRKACSYELIVVSPEEIDSRLAAGGTLNEIEVECFAKAIEALRPEVVYIDACDVNAERFGINVRRLLGFEAEVVSRHNADKEYPIVSAASILAKVHRDALVKKISTEVGEDVGSGYPNDPMTIRFLKGYYSKNGEMPPFVRKSWKTTSTVIGDCLQSRLTGFL
jgi:ribonuclease HII